MTSFDNRPPRPPFARPAAWWRVRVGVALVGVAALSACSSASPQAGGPSTVSSPAATASSAMSSMGASSAAGSPQLSAETVILTIDKFAYSTLASVSPGARITVQNKDGDNHTVTAESAGAFDVKVEAGASADFTAPTAPGSYPFHCVFHPNMRGVLVVK